MNEQYAEYSYFIDVNGKKYTDEEWYENIKQTSGEAVANSTFALLRQSIKETQYKIMCEMENGSNKR